MMSPDLIDVIARVQEQLGEQLEILERDGGTYAKACAETTLRPARIAPPKPPRGMHPKVRAMVRELVSDELYVRRRSGAR